MGPPGEVMAFDAIIDVAEIDDLGDRVLAEEPRALVVRQATESSRVLKRWAAALATIALVGFAGNFLEKAPPEEAADASVLLAQRPPAHAATNPKWPAFGHSGFRYPASATTNVSLQLTRVAGTDGSIARVDVSGRIDGPIGNISVRLVSGSEMYEEITRYFASAGLVAPGPYGVFDLSFAVPGNAALSDLWVVVRAYVGERLVAMESVAVDPTSATSRRDKYVIDDMVDPSGLTSTTKSMPTGRLVARFER